jgi:Outer membrane protein beta-barrel domain
MKKFLPTLLFFCLFLSASFSQTQLRIGFRGGINLATYHQSSGSGILAGTVITQPQNMTLSTVGLPLEVSFSHSFALQAEFNFIQKGFKSHFDLTTTQGISFISDSKLTVNWVEIPVLAKFRFGSQQGFGGGLFVGPSIGYGINGRSQFSFTSSATTTGMINSSSDDRKLDFKNDEHSRVDLALNLGAEINFGGFFLDTRYQLGLVDMQTNKNISSPSSVSVKTRGIALTVGYRLPIILGAEKAAKKK